MCCNKTIMTQEELLQMHIAADTDTKTEERTNSASSDDVK
jgi:hypothetical protein